MLARDSIVYYVIVFGLCVLALKDYWQLTPTIRYFLACIMMDIVEDTTTNITVSVTM
jgi:hypothetical protein